MTSLDLRGTTRLPEPSMSPDRAMSSDHPSAAPVVDVVVPVYNEAAGLAGSVERLHAYLSDNFPMPWRITIADNASVDATWPLACQLSHELAGVHAIRLAEKGRGRALHAAWSDSDATVLVYMDVDLSTDLKALLPLVAPLLSGHSDLAIGTRLARGSHVVRGPKREVISRSYNAILRTTLGTGFSDAQCGFKAIRRDCARQLLPLVKDQAWFFDTELLVLAERAGLRIHEVPVDWVDDPDSRVDIVSTALEDLKGVARLQRGLSSGRIPLDALRLARGRQPDLDASRPQQLGQQVVSFVAIGTTSTLAYLLLFLGLRQVTGSWAANALALAATAVANTAANRRWTFGIRDRAGAARHQLQGLVVFALALGLTTGALLALHRGDPSAGRLTEAGVLVAANLLATALRFVLLRAWVFRTTTDRSAS